MDRSQATAWPPAGLSAEILLASEGEIESALDLHYGHALAIEGHIASEFVVGFAVARHHFEFQKRRPRLAGRRARQNRRGQKGL